MAADYNGNALSADSKYKDKIVKIRGEVANVSKTFGDVIVYLVADEYGLMTVNCTVKKSEIGLALRLSKGDDVIIVGKVDGELLGFVNVSGCIIER